MTAPQQWAQAYNDYVTQADKPGADENIILPTAILPAPLVREILKLFEPEADF